MVTDTENLLVPAVNQTIDALDLKPEDAAAVKLAQRYAAAIDDSVFDGPRAHASAMRWIAPQLLAVLESLGATPLARTRLAKASDGDGTPNRLQQLRDARRA
jgi:hypothetical protein